MLAWNNKYLLFFPEHWQEDVMHTIHWQPGRTERWPGFSQRTAQSKPVWNSANAHAVIRKHASHMKVSGLPLPALYCPSNTARLSLAVWLALVASWHSPHLQGHPIRRQPQARHFPVCSGLEPWGLTTNCFVVWRRREWHTADLEASVCVWLQQH